MTTRETEYLDKATILQRIDAIVQELSELRRLIEGADLPTEGLTEHLLGCLGSEPLEDYDHNLDWTRFSNELPA